MANLIKRSDEMFSVSDIEENTEQTTPEEYEMNLDDRLKLASHELEKSKINRVLREWSEQQGKDRDLRKKFGYCLLGALIIQLVIMTTIFYLDAVGYVTVDVDKLPIWLGALVIEVIGLVMAIVKGLFVNTTAEFFNMVKSVLNHKDD